MCSFSSRSARRTAPTTLSLLELPDEPPPVARASTAPPPPSGRGAAAGARPADAGGAAGARAIDAPAGAGKEISMKSAPDRTSPPAA